MLYIGRTSQTLEERLAEHKHTAKSKNPMLLSKWIKENGEDKMEIHLIEDFDTFDESALAETMYIRKYTPQFNVMATHTHTAESLLAERAKARMRREQYARDGDKPKQKPVSEEKKKEYLENRKKVRALRRADAEARGLFRQRGRKPQTPEIYQ